MKYLRLLPLIVLAGLSITCAEAQNMFVDTSTAIYEYSNGVQTTFATGLNYPGGMTFDSAGDLFVSGGYNGVSGDGLIYEFVNSHGVLSSTPVTIATGLYNPSGIACDSAGDVLVANQGNGRIYEYANQNGTINSTAITYIGTFSKLTGMAFGSASNLYVADYNAGTVTKVLPPFADDIYGGSQGAEPFAQNLDGATGLAFDSLGNLYVSILLDNKIDKITPSGVVSTFAATGITYPDAMAFDSAGDLLVASAAAGKIYEFTNNDGTLSSTPGTMATLSGAGGGLVFQPASVPVPVPRFTAISLTGTTLTLTATNGADGGQCVLLESTNLMLPLNQWTPVLTNNFDPGGNLSLSMIETNPGTAEFFILSQ